MAEAETIPFDNSYARLPEAFFARVAPTPVAHPRVLRLNRPLARQLRLDPDFLASDAGAEVLAGNRLPQGAEPLAMAYAGHQFGNFVPQLGDGRAVLLGELVDRDGVRRDLHLKGAGLTPFSRAADGRAGLSPVLREYLASEAMAGLGIPTTRALAITATGETVYRHGPEPGAVLTRVARSHVRIGTFEYFHHRGQHDAVRTLADYVLARHYPEESESAQPYRALLDAMAGHTAELIAQWMLVGFVHGVMNTDNMSLAGETIDYGPFAFIDTYHPAAVFSSIDTGGRYAFNRQPSIGHWNLAQFAETLLPFLGETEEDAVAAAREALERYVSRFETVYHAGLCRKLGLTEGRDDNIRLAYDLLERMARQRADYTLTFRRLADISADDASADEPVRALFDEPESFDAWAEAYRRRLAGEGIADDARRAAMRAVNPAYVPRLHLLQRAVDAASEHGDLSVLDELFTVLTAPYDDHPELAGYAQPPRPEEVVPRTFCGT